ncbi:rCG25295, isoform CRA_a [Rattus norvegicus]|uniref:RCG25295, isoform CRA_a n=1 Tax=Rattus norvegicus TaxID=10116 RepID=A6I289_RAT|nr:rCG25295, isoform CRA_a [Rattus norvegicus]EDL77488.1 rCG25295, isoform CRA_a [Rattus norvegicus]
MAHGLRTAVPAPSDVLSQAGNEMSDSYSTLHVSMSVIQGVSKNKGQKEVWP